MRVSFSLRLTGKSYMDPLGGKCKASRPEKLQIDALNLPKLFNFLGKPAAF
jgi:hypothetical protein